MNDLSTAASKNAGKARTPMSPARKACLWIIRVDVILMVVITVYALLSQNLTLLWIDLFLLLVYFITLIVSRIIWVREKLLKEASEKEKGIQEPTLKG